MGDNLRDPSIFRIAFFSDNANEKFSIKYKKIQEVIA
jgi:hypothetical protein